MTPGHDRYDALVIGAGVAGSTAALLLARAGWSVVLVEKQRFPRRKVCGECVSASNLALLDVLGVGAQFAAAAGPELRRVAVMQGEHTVCAELPAFATGKHPWGRALGREVLDTLLLTQARAAGAEVLQPWVARSLTGAPGAYECLVSEVEGRRSELLRAAVVIDAHGSWERLRAAPVPLPRASRPREPQSRERQPGGLLPGRALFGFKANFRGTALAAGVLPVLSFTGGYGGMVLAGDGVTTVACCIRADRLAVLRRASPGVAAGEVVGAALRSECAGVRDALHGARREGPWLASGPLRPGRHLARDGVFRIGNAAGEAHPIIGEGMSMALQGAFLLAAHLAPGPRTTLELTDARWQHRVAARYRTQWRAHFTTRLRFAAVCAHLAMRPTLSRPLLPLLERWSGVLGHVAVCSGKVRCAVDLEQEYA